MQTLELYGIKTCGSVKKAISFLNAHSIPFYFIDLKTHTPSLQHLQQWTAQKGIEVLFNTKGTTYKNLKKEDLIPANLSLQDKITLLHQYPMLLKRPIISYEKMLIVGFDEKSLMLLKQAYKGNK